MNSSEIINKLTMMGVKQVEIAEYLGVTRQTVAKIKKGGYFKFSDESKERLEYLENHNKEDIDKIFAIDQKLKLINKMIMSKDSDYIDHAYEGINYMSYWLLDKKFEHLEKYHKHYYGHMNNFYPRYNQAALFMRDMFNRREYPLVTFQVDYKANMITKFCIKSFKPDVIDTSYSTDDVVFPITFQSFIQLLVEKVKPKARFLLYKDYVDDEWQYIVDKLKQSEVIEHELFDLSRLLNFYDNPEKYYGPLIEDVLHQFRITFDDKRILTDCEYRASKIIELINMVSLEELSTIRRDKSSRLFDSHGLKKDNNFLQKERRKQKGEI